MESDHQPFSQRAQASVDVAVSVTYTKNLSEATHMEHVQLSLLPCTKGPGLTAVQERAQDTGSIDLDLGMCHQLLIEPYSFCESREHGSCFANAFIQLDI